MQSNQHPPGDRPTAESPARPPWLTALLWALWVVEVIAFLALAGCSLLLMTIEGNWGVLVVVVIALALFVYAVRISLVSNREGQQRPLLGATLILLAAFIIFGGCAVVLN